MNRPNQVALAVLAGISLAAGALLYLAVAAESSPGAGVLIAVGAGMIAGCVPLVRALEERSAPGGCKQG